MLNIYFNLSLQSSFKNTPFQDRECRRTAVLVGYQLIPGFPLKAFPITHSCVYIHMKGCVWDESVSIKKQCFWASGKQLIIEDLYS